MIKATRICRIIYFLGQMYDIGGGQKLFLGCQGKGRPTGTLHK